MTSQTEPLTSKYDQAIADYTEAIRHDPLNADAYRARGRIWSDRNQNDKAHADYTEASRVETLDRRGRSSD